MVNPKLKILRFNPWAREITCYSEEEAIGRHCGDILHGGMCGVLYELYQPKASQRGIKLELQIAGVLPIIKADVDRLRRVFTNLFDNAIKFSKEKGTITTSAEDSDEEVTVQIKDDGIGISPQDLPFIFDLFYFYFRPLLSRTKCC